MNKTSLKTNAAAGLCFTLLLAACATDDPERRTKTGLVIGTVAGAVVGKQIGDDKGALIGATIGAITGASVGRYQDEQQRALEASLADERRDRVIEIERLEDETLAVSLSSEASFDFDSSDIKPAFYDALDRLADELIRYDRTVLHVIGHTDSTGPIAYNRALSVRRADSVARYLMLRGVDSARLRIEGRGELEPRLPNDSEENRRLNRRVEIFIQPVIEGEEERALRPPNRLRPS